MKKIFAGLLTALLTISMTLAAMFVLVRTTIYVTGIGNNLQQALAMCAELLLGVIFLVGTVWLATHLAVRIFGAANPSLPPR
jgi:ACR3 family arsenite efflux pump ArsB